MCHEPVVDTKKLPQSIQDLVYKPEPDEIKNVEVDLKEPAGFTGDNEE